MKGRADTLTGGLLRLAALISVSALVFYFDAAYAKAEGSDRGKEEAASFISGLIKEFDFDDIDDSLRAIFPQERIKFGDILSGFVTGEDPFEGKGFLNAIFRNIELELKSNKKNVVWLLLISVCAGLFANLSGSFSSSEASEAGFYILYMLLITVCLKAFHAAMAMTKEKVAVLLDFMRLLCPAYFMAVAMATGFDTSAIFYNIILFTIFAAEFVIQKVILPVVNIYIIVNAMNFLSGEAYLSQLADLLKKAAGLGLKGLIAVVTGINLIQGMLTPAIDLVKRSAFAGAASSIPGIGNAVGGAADLFLASALLIRNGIGAAGAVLIAAICAAPVIHAGILALIYKLAAAASEPVSDKRISGCIASLSEAYLLLVKIIFSAALLFLVTVAVLTFSAGKPA